MFINYFKWIIKTIKSIQILDYEIVCFTKRYDWKMILVKDLSCFVFTSHTFSLASWFKIIWARWAIAPASTTVCANSGECLQMSLRADAAIRLSDNSGSWMHNTNKGTAPASTTAWASSVKMGDKTKSLETLALSRWKKTKCLETLALSIWRHGKKKV